MEKMSTVGDNYHRMILDNISFGVQIAQILYDDQGVPNDYLFLEVNSAFADIMELPKEKIIGKKVKAFYPNAEPEWFIKYGKAIKSSKPESFEAWSKYHSCWYNILAIPLGEDKFAIVFIDVSERKLIDEENQLLVNEIQAERDRLTALIYNIPDEVWFTDKDGDIILTNQTTQGKFGENYLGVNVAKIAESLETYNSDGSRRLLDETPLIRATKGEKLIDGEEIIRLPINKELRYRWFNATPVCDKENNIIGAVAITRDITRQKQVEKKVLALVSELEKADKNKNEFINILSHELRNPLTTIKGGIALLKLTNEDKNNEKIIEILDRQTNHLTKLINDMLDITRITQNKIVMEKEQVNLNKILNDAIEDRKQQFDEKNIKLIKNMCKKDIVVNVDTVRITQCIGNILGNALKFTDEGGTVRISLEIQGKNAEINVQDNGIGIRPEKLATIFEPFKQDFNPYANYDNSGLGLGLHIVKKYMEMHNGSVSASSPGVGKGTTFTLELPITDK